ncbi:MAG: hypothetical protein Gaeavirus23_3 [Gaeavirus sp.]|uniref:Uncharacterized protein n=1 Tax=Gaeavirus sp. TaxID=2487767 RepID=A0A3G5A190_9VIRU|nr:MAG: hypothetical protein Gaeavirus23_3 [Gaeavirus sp.]
MITELYYRTNNTELFTDYYFNKPLDIISKIPYGCKVYDEYDNEMTLQHT